ncbi:alkaline shock response membrane anchor protein AmaP [Vagococcus sp. AM17-17]|nr:alkaline shock response membrane anchor protein AmaP [Vagococcus sp. AM17-17]
MTFRKKVSSLKTSIKIFLTILILTLIIPLFSAITISQYAVSLPFSLIKIQNYPYFNTYLSSVIFWLSIFWICVSLVSIVILLFIPVKKNQIKIKESSGYLSVQNKAIDNFILNILKNEPFLEDPKVTSILKKNKIIVNIEANINESTNDLVKRKESISKTIEHRLLTLFGIEENMTVRVNFQNYKSSDSNKSRVI